MPAQKRSPGTVRVVVNGLLSGQNTVNVFHLNNVNDFSHVYTQGEVNAVATAVRAAWASNFLPRQSGTDFVLGAVQATDLGSAVGLVGVASGTSAGGRGGASLPANVAACISWTTPLHFRGGHARTYLPGAVQADQANATSWSTLSITAWQTAATGFLASLTAPMAGMSMVPVMLSRQRAGVIFNVPERYAINGSSVDSRIDSMRRRLGKDR